MVDQKSVIEMVQKELFEMQDEGYRAFHGKLIPNICALFLRKNSVKNSVILAHFAFFFA